MAQKIDFKKFFMPAIIVTVAIMVVNWLLNLWTGYTTLFAAIQPVSAISGTLGQQVLGWIGGIIPITSPLTGMMVVILFVSSYLVLLVGTFLIDTIKLPILKIPGLNERVNKLATVILYGAFIAYILLGLAVNELFNISLIFGLLLHTIAVAYSAAWIGDTIFKVSI